MSNHEIPELDSMPIRHPSFGPKGINRGQLAFEGLISMADEARLQQFEQTQNPPVKRTSIDLPALAQRMRQLKNGEIRVDGA